MNVESFPSLDPAFQVLCVQVLFLIFKTHLSVVG